MMLVVPIFRYTHNFSVQSKLAAGNSICDTSHKGPEIWVVAFAIACNVIESQNNIFDFAGAVGDFDWLDDSTVGDDRNRHAILMLPGESFNIVSLLRDGILDGSEAINFNLNVFSGTHCGNLVSQTRLVFARFNCWLKWKQFNMFVFILARTNDNEVLGCVYFYKL